MHGIGGAAGVLWYALMAKKELVTELYGETLCCVLHNLSGLRISQHTGYAGSTQLSWLYWVSLGGLAEPS